MGTSVDFPFRLEVDRRKSFSFFTSPRRWAYSRRLPPPPGSPPTFQGGKMAEELDYVPLPGDVVSAVKKLWLSEIKDVSGKPIFWD
jgi:hypothetical protein